MANPLHSHSAASKGFDLRVLRSVLKQTATTQQHLHSTLDQPRPTMTNHDQPTVGLSLKINTRGLASFLHVFPFTRIFESVPFPGYSVSANIPTHFLLITHCSLSSWRQHLLLLCHTSCRNLKSSSSQPHTSKLPKMGPDFCFLSEAAERVVRETGVDRWHPHKRDRRSTEVEVERLSHKDTRCLTYSGEG